MQEEDEKDDEEAEEEDDEAEEEEEECEVSPEKVFSPWGLLECLVADRFNHSNISSRLDVAKGKSPNG